MGIQIKNNNNKVRSLEDIRDELCSLKGHDILLLSGQMYRNSEIYTKPRRRTIIGYTNHKLVTKDNRGCRETILFKDIYSQNIIYEILG